MGGYPVPLLLLGVWDLVGPLWGRAISRGGAGGVGGLASLERLLCVVGGGGLGGPLGAGAAATAASTTVAATSACSCLSAHSSIFCHRSCMAAIAAWTVSKMAVRGVAQRRHSRRAAAAALSTRPCGGRRPIRWRHMGCRHLG